MKVLVGIAFGLLFDICENDQFRVLWPKYCMISSTLLACLQFAGTELQDDHTVSWLTEWTLHTKTIEIKCFSWIVCVDNCCLVTWLLGSKFKSRKLLYNAYNATVNIGQWLRLPFMEILLSIQHYAIVLTRMHSNVPSWQIVFTYLSACCWCQLIAMQRLTLPQITKQISPRFWKSAVAFMDIATERNNQRYYSGI